MPTSHRSQALCLEERFHKFSGVKRQQVLDLLPDANELNGQAQFAGDGDDHAAFGRAVEFGQDDARGSGVLLEFTRLLEAVLSCRGVNDVLWTATDSTFLARDWPITY